MNYSKELDCILKNLLKNRSGLTKPVITIDCRIDNDETVGLIKVLIDDGYALSNEDVNIELITITPKGKIFLLSGGYKKKTDLERMYKRLAVAVSISVILTALVALAEFLLRLRGNQCGY